MTSQSAEMKHDLLRRVSDTTAACNDLVEGTTKSWMWSAMAMQDIKMRYRGSLLGPFWLTVSMITMIAAMGLIYARMFHLEFSFHGDHRRLSDLPIGAEHHYSGAVAILDPRLAQCLPQLDSARAQHGNRAVCTNLVRRPFRMVCHSHYPGARHPHDQRHLDQYLSRNDQCSLSRRAANRGKLRAGHLLRYANLLAAGSAGHLDARAAPPQSTVRSR